MGLGKGSKKCRKSLLWTVPSLSNDGKYCRTLSSNLHRLPIWQKVWQKMTKRMLLSNSPLTYRFLPAPIGISDETTISIGIKSRSDSLEMATHKYNKATMPSLCDKCSSGHVSKTIWVKSSLKTLSISLKHFKSYLRDLSTCKKKLYKCTNVLI